MFRGYVSFREGKTGEECTKLFWPEKTLNFQGVLLTSNL